MHDAAGSRRYHRRKTAKGDEMTARSGKTTAVWCKTATWLAMPLALAACGSGGGVVKMDEKTYMVVSSSRWQGNMGVAAAGLRQADAYCKGLGRKMVMTGAETSDGFVGVLPPKAVIMFRCDPVRGSAPDAAAAVPAKPVASASGDGTSATGAGVVVKPLAPSSASSSPAMTTQP